MWWSWRASKRRSRATASTVPRCTSPSRTVNLRGRRRLRSKRRPPTAKPKRQRGSLKKVKKKEGLTWVLRYRVGGREQTPLVVGLVADFRTLDEAELEVDRLGLRVRINCADSGTRRIRFDELAEYYLKVESEVTARPKSENTKPILEHYLRDVLIAKWRDEIAEDIEPLEMQKWFNRSLEPEFSQYSCGLKPLLHILDFWFRTISAPDCFRTNVGIRHRLRGQSPPGGSGESVSEITLSRTCRLRILGIGATPCDPNHLQSSSATKSHRM